jgi:hypothetical protein
MQYVIVCSKYVCSVLLVNQAMYAPFSSCLRIKNYCILLMLSLTQRI